jgi:hypothetical protein
VDRPAAAFLARIRDQRSAKVAWLDFDIVARPAVFAPAFTAAHFAIRAGAFGIGE